MVKEKISQTRRINVDRCPVAASGGGLKTTSEISSRSGELIFSNGNEG